MKILTINGKILKKMIISGSNELTKNRQKVDTLNVFPVPDGDTGTNMSLTMDTAAKEASKSNSEAVCEIAKIVSSGSLRGARGNSGVILSQIFRGFSKGLEHKNEAYAKDIAEAFSKASEAAYKAVMKAKEGTILTIIRAIGEKAVAEAKENDDIKSLFEAIIKHGNEMLLKTTEMLPALKQANVVDAGGKGLMYIIEGMYKALISSEDFEIIEEKDTGDTISNAFTEFNTEDIEFGYCTEFFIKGESFTEKDEDVLKSYLSEIGDSIVVVADDDIIKVHVHTENPGAALEKAVQLGELTKIKIENMREQHSAMIDFKEEEKPKVPQEQLEVGFVSVCSGDGIKDYFEKLGVNYVISGGQTMNPSIDDILVACEKINAKEIVILPNNKNIILAAKQAAEIKENVHVVETKTIPQGIAAMVSYLPFNSVSQNLESINEAITQVKTGLVTYAVRELKNEKFNIKEGDILCMIEDEIAVVGENVADATKSMIDELLKDGGDIVTIFYGKEQSEEEAHHIADYIALNYDEVEIEVKEGLQPVYYYIISVE